MAFTLSTETYPGFPAGMNLALPAQDLSDSEAQYLQDTLVDFPALTRRRGPLSPVSGIAQPTLKGSGIFTTLDPSGAVRYALAGDDGTHGVFQAWSADLSTLSTVQNLPYRLPTAPPSSPYRIVASSTGLKGGLLIGARSDYGVGAESTFGYWLGGISPAYSTGTITATRGSTSVTGSGTSWTANVSPGMWLFASTDEGYTSTLIGAVKAVTSNTAITLMDPSPYALTAKAYSTQALRGLYPRVMTGRVTCATSTTDLNGGDTAFKTQGLATGTWQVYRFRDWAFIGKITSVESEIHATLTGNAAIAMANEQYIAIRADGNWSLDAHNSATSPGSMSASYAGRQFYLNTDDTWQDTYRLVYTEVDDVEAYNLGYAGTWTPVQNTTDVQESGRAVAAAYNGLIVLKDTEAFLLNGTDPSLFSIAKIGDDGALSTGSVQTYNGGVIWAGRLGVHFYDGVQVQNLTLSKLGQVWKNSITTFDPTKYRMWSFIYSDHYHLFIESIAPTVAPQKGSVTLQPTRWGVTINLVTQAVTMSTNLPIRGALTQPSTAGGNAWFLVNGQVFGDTADKGYVADARALFESEGTDVIYGDYSVAGPTVTNMIPNGGAEVDTTGWFAFSGNTLTRTTSQHQYGAAAFQWVTTVTQGGGFVTGSEFNVYPGPYTVSFWHKTPVGKTVFFAVDYFIEDGDSVPDTPNEESTHFAGTGNWQYDTYTFHVPPAGVHMDFELGFEGIGTFYLDGIQLESGAVAHGYVNTTVGAVTGIPAVISPSEIAGPDFYIESKKFDAGDGMRLKKWKILAANYLAQGGALNIDTVIGLNDFGATLSTELPASVFTWQTLAATFRTWGAMRSKFTTWSSVVNGVFVPKRVKFQKQSQYFSFRIYQSSINMQRVKLGPFMLAYKLMRAGRV